MSAAADKLRVIGRGARECGTCTACCTLMAIEELNKPEFTDCAHICGSRCAIYEERPKSCADWDCLWLYGYLPDRFRPERSALVFTPQREGAHKDLGAHIVGAREVKPSASRMAQGERAIRWFTGKGISVLVQAESGERWLHPGKGGRPLLQALLRKRGVAHEWNGRWFSFTALAETKASKGVSHAV